MQNTDQGKFNKFDASSYRVGIVVAQFNRTVTDGLLTNALEAIEGYKIPKNNLTIIHVPGCVEAPLMLKKLAELGKYDCLVALGAVIRGETSHFDYVAKIITDGVLRVSLDMSIPIGFGILTTENLSQAQARLEFGASAATAALQSAKLIKGL